MEYLFARADSRQIELGISTAILTTPGGEVVCLHVPGRH
jgi:hypothetical protein